MKISECLAVARQAAEEIESERASLLEQMTAFQTERDHEKHRAETLFTENQRLNKVLAEQAIQVADLKVQVARLLGSKGEFSPPEGGSREERREERRARIEKQMARVERYLNRFDSWSEFRRFNPIE